ncbi:MAG: hypothetical protein AB1631_02540 [Acidobacteriota bacterium]
MAMLFNGNGSQAMRVPAGERVVLRVKAHDPAGISRVMVRCFLFSMAHSNRVKLAEGEAVLSPEESFTDHVFDISVEIPENAALGKWGVQMIEFTNGRGYKTSFYRGQGKFDSLVFEVVPPPSKEDEMLQFDGVELMRRK